MTECADCCATIHLLLDGELVGEELDQARAHLKICGTCTQRFEEEKSLSQMIRQSRSPQVASAALRARVLQIASEAAPAKEKINETHRPVSVLMPDRRRASTVLTPGYLTLMAATLLITLGAILFPHLRSQQRQNSFITTAVLADRSLATHVMPLDVQSSSPAEVTAWFTSRVPFKFRLPNAGIAAEDTAKYTMVGGRLVDFKGEHAALISFRMAGENISLLIASDRLANAVGGNVSKSNGLVFHTRQMEDQNVVTWDNQGLTYALIFSAPHSARRACSTCHEGSSADGHPLVDKAYLSQPF
jgi:anti-sigma factor RsiW